MIEIQPSIRVLCDGFVKLINIAGPVPDEITKIDHIVEWARVFKKSKTSVNNTLMRLIEERHVSTWESIEIWMHFRVPIMVARQLMRHRAFSYIEFSARYFEFDKRIPLDFYIPDRSSEEAQNVYAETYNIVEQAYHKLLQLGEPKELARLVMPVAVFTEFGIKGTLRDWFFMLQARTAQGAQHETREVACAALKLLQQALPSILWDELHAQER